MLTYRIKREECFKLIIGDGLLTKIMLTNTLSRNEKIRSQMSESSQFSSLFSTVLNQLLTEQGSHITEQRNIDIFLSDIEILNRASYQTSLNPTTENRNTLNQLLSIGSDSISADNLDLVLKGKLSGMGQTFIDAGRKYNVDPALLVAISQHETGNGKSRAAEEKNNIAGMMGKNGLKSYASVQESIMDMARNVSENYVAKGLTSIATIGAKYAPIGAVNDPTGLNNNWVNGVTKYYNRLNIG